MAFVNAHSDRVVGLDSMRQKDADVAGLALHRFLINHRFDVCLWSEAETGQRAAGFLILREVKRSNATLAPRLSHASTPGRSGID